MSFLIRYLGLFLDYISDHLAPLCVCWGEGQDLTWGNLEIYEEHCRECGGKLKRQWYDMGDQPLERRCRAFHCTSLLVYELSRFGSYDMVCLNCGLPQTIDIDEQYITIHKRWSGSPEIPLDI